MFPSKTTLLLQAFSLVKVPLLGMIRPQVVELSPQASSVKLPLNFLTKNHLGSMYFGALAMGAELSIALKIVEMNRVSQRKVSFIFKDFGCEFLKRAESDVVFTCHEVQAIEELIDKAFKTGQRENGRFMGKAFSIKDLTAPLMTYYLTVSVKPSKA